MRSVHVLCGVLGWSIVVSAASTAAHAAVVSFQEGVGGYTGTQDTWVEAGNNTNFGGQDYMETANTPSKPQAHQTLIRFDNIVGGGLQQIPAGSTINSATLTITGSGFGDGFLGTATVSRVLVDWDETVGGSVGVFAGGVALDGSDASSTAAFTGSLGGGQPIPPINITGLVQGWVDNPATNFGVVFSAPPASGFNILFLSSSERDVASARPLLTVDFTPIPEPTTLAAIGAIGGILLSRRTRRLV